MFILGAPGLEKSQPCECCQPLTQTTAAQDLHSHGKTPQPGDFTLVSPSHGPGIMCVSSDRSLTSGCGSTLAEAASALPCWFSLWHPVVSGTYTISKGLYSSPGFLLSLFDGEHCWVLLCSPSATTWPCSSSVFRDHHGSTSFPSSTPLCRPVQMRLCAGPFLGVPVQSCRIGPAWMMNAG